MEETPCKQHGERLARVEEHSRAVNGQIKSIQTDVREIRDSVDQLKGQQKLWSGGLALLVVLTPYVMHMLDK